MMNIKSFEYWIILRKYLFHFRSFLIFFFLSFCMPMISQKYEREAQFMLLYLLPLLQTSLTVSVYSTVAITLHGLHEIQKSTKLAVAMSPCPSNVNGDDLIEYESMVMAAGMLNRYFPAHFPLRIFQTLCQKLNYWK